MLTPVQLLTKLTQISLQGRLFKPNDLKRAFSFEPPRSPFEGVEVDASQVIYQELYDETLAHLTADEISTLRQEIEIGLMNENENQQIVAMAKKATEAILNPKLSAAKV